MKTALISVTQKGAALTLSIKQRLGSCKADRFCFYKTSDIQSESFSDIKKLAGDIFDQYDALVFVCACGIAVRSISPHIRSKLTDPAVIVIDDCGQYVIPILSGHIGGANEYAKKLSELIGSQAVITTATDIGGVFSPDSFAKANGLLIEDMAAAKQIACAVLDGEKIGLMSEYEYKNKSPYIVDDQLCRAGIYIGTEKKTPFELTLRLVPKNIVLGIGCKKGTGFEEISLAVKNAFEKACVDIKRLCAVCSIDLKAGEKGLIEFCSHHKTELITYTADELMETSGDFDSSEFVKNVTGADNVCERSAVRYGGRLILKKQVQNKVTSALAQMPVTIDLEKEQM